MNKLRKFKIDTKQKAADAAINAVDQIVPSNLLAASTVLADLLGPESSSEMVQELQRYAKLIEAARQPPLVETWSRFEKAQMDPNHDVHVKLMMITDTDVLYANNRYQVAIKFVWPKSHVFETNPEADENPKCSLCGIWASDVHSADGPPAVCTDRKRMLLRLSIKRLDRAPIHDWRDLQRIKNEIAGPEFEALEMYPAESRLVDTSNQYHLWVLPAGEKLQFGYATRCIMEEEDFGIRQRPFTDPAQKQEAAETFARMKSGDLGNGNDAILKSYLDVRQEADHAK